MKQYRERFDPDQHNWTAVSASATTLSGLINTWVSPVNLLTPTAFNLDISEADSGQALSITAPEFMSGGLLNAIKHMDRHLALLICCILQILMGLAAGCLALSGKTSLLRSFFWHLGQWLWAVCRLAAQLHCR